MAKTNINESSEFKSPCTDGRAPNGHAKRIPLFSEIPELPDNLPKATKKQIAEVDELVDKLSKLEAKKEPHKAALKDIEEKQSVLDSHIHALAIDIHQSILDLFKAGRLTEAFLVFKYKLRVVLCVRKVTQDLNWEALNGATLEFLLSKNPALADEVQAFQDKFLANAPIRIRNTYSQFEPAQGNK